MGNERANLLISILKPGWRNWQTQRTQNPPRFTPRGGSTPPPGTSLRQQLHCRWDKQS
jgi:hypothetical protein